MDRLSLFGIRQLIVDTKGKHHQAKLYCRPGEIMMSSCQVTHRETRFCNRHSRRAVVALPDWLDSLSHAADRPKRSEFSSDTGKKMLELYKKAIIEMRDNEKKKHSRYHPHHWYFQGNIHGYPLGDEVPVFDPNQTSNQAEKAKIKAYKEIALGTAQRRVSGRPVRTMGILLTF